MIKITAEGEFRGSGLIKARDGRLNTELIK